MERPIDGTRAALAPTTPNENTPPAATTVPDSISGQQFSQYKFYLDNIDDQQQKKIRDRLTLLDSSVEAFFSSKCTHVVTTKPIPGKLTASGENARSNDTIIANAMKWNMKIWSLDYMNKTLQSMVHGHRIGHRANRKAIGRILEDEKKFGVGTNHGGTSNRTDAKAARPEFVPFKHYYISVEDMRGVHRPVAVKEYAQWQQAPYLKSVPPGKSPYTRMPPRPPQQPLSQPVKGQAKEEDKENARPLSQQPAKASAQQHLFAKPLLDSSKAAIPSNTPLDARHPNNTTQHSSSHLKASGICPSQSVNAPSRSTRILATSRIVSTSESTTKVYMDNNQDECLARLDRRMVDSRANGKSRPLLKTAAMNQTASAKDTADAKEKEKDKPQEDRRKALAQRKLEQEMHWCENCNKRYSNLKEHLQEKAHQAFVKDQNNFSRFDALVATLRRPRNKDKPVEDRMEIDANE
ncbi:hypothetical protein BJV82DRAFT_578827 [Fennellomyces sp. T-0311]|nr:hypothetical protein BJV82DRAFT_578827 [Fennellomyces sp. T-0311]